MINVVVAGGVARGIPDVAGAMAAVRENSIRVRFGPLFGVECTSVRRDGRNPAETATAIMARVAVPAGRISETRPPGFSNLKQYLIKSS